MIQVVSAYLLIQRGNVTDDDPSHIEPKYEPKNRFKRWLLEDPMNFDKHIYVGVGSSQVLKEVTYHRETLWHSAYRETDSYSISPVKSSEYTTLDGATSAKKLNFYTWGWIKRASYVFSGIGSYSAGSDIDLNQIQYFNGTQDTWFEVNETRTSIIEKQGSSSLEPPPTPDPLSGTMQYSTFCAQSYTMLIDETDSVTFYSARIVNGVPVFATYEAGIDYCEKLGAYLENQSSANYEAVCGAIDNAINQ